MKALRGLGGLIGVALLGACGSSTEITVDNLEGIWDAATYVYTNAADPAEQVDVIAAEGASLTLTVQADGTTSSVFDDGQGGTSSDSGTFTAEGQTLTLAGVTYQASVSGDRLTLTNGTAQYDFNGDGSDEPATLRITLDRR